MDDVFFFKRKWTDVNHESDRVPMKKYIQSINPGRGSYFETAGRKAGSTLEFLS
jgi:hypothetical protein